jgi:hypothetical protein
MRPAEDDRPPVYDALKLLYEKAARVRERSGELRHAAEEMRHHLGRDRFDRDDDAGARRQV